MESHPDIRLSRFLALWRGPQPYVEAMTSGSTGEPKRVRLLKSDMVASAEATCRFFGIGSGSVLHLPLSLDYIAGKMMAVRAEVSRARLFVEKPSTTPLPATLPGVDRIDLTAIVPSQVDGLLASPMLGRIDNVIVGGAPLSQEQESRLAACRSLHPWATYGMTETCSHVALRDISAREEFYTALPGITFDADPRGCLVIAAPAMSFGHLVTNDIVRLIDDRRFCWLGRTDDVIVTGGEKVFPRQVEDTLARTVPDLGPIAVTSAPDPLWGESIVLVMEEGGYPLPVDRLRVECRRVLPRHHVPKHYVVIPTLPLTPTGKIARTRLKSIIADIL